MVSFQIYHVFRCNRFNQIIKGNPPVVEIVESSCGAANAAGIRACTQIECTIDPTLAAQILAGPLPITVAVTPQCETPYTGTPVRGLPTPAIVTVTPPRICAVVSSGIIQFDGNFVISYRRCFGLSLTVASGSRFANPPLPTISAHTPLTSSAIALSLATPSNCQTIAGTSQQQCTRVTASAFTPSMVGLVPGEDDTPIELVATNDLCSEMFEDLALFSLVPVAIVESVEPLNVCFDQTTVVEIRGRRFSTGLAQLRLIHVDGTEYAGVVDGTGEFVVQSVANQVITIEIQQNRLRSGRYDVEVTNLAGCVHVLPAALFVQPTVVVAFATPPVIYNDINIQITVFSSGLLAKVDRVTVRHSITGTELVVPGSMTTHPPNNFQRSAVCGAGRPRSRFV